MREKSLSLRKHVQENESLEFRNQQVYTESPLGQWMCCCIAACVASSLCVVQLSKRVEMLQGDLGSPLSKRKKKVKCRAQ